MKLSRSWWDSWLFILYKVYMGTVEVYQFQYYIFSFTGKRIQIKLKDTCK